LATSARTSADSPAVRAVFFQFVLLFYQRLTLLIRSLEVHDLFVNESIHALRARVEQTFA
jgi:hypothetical protein